MAKNLGRCLALAAAFSYVAAPVFAQEAGLQPLQAAFAGAKLPFQAFTPHSLLTPEQQDALSQAEKILRQQPALPAPNDAVLKWLSQRVPGLDVKNIKEINFETGVMVMAKASAAKATWMDVLSDAAFRGQTIYYVSQDVLNQLDAKYYAGLIPVRGSTEDGQTFQMQAFLAGQGKVHLLFNFTDFTYKDEGKRFKVDNGGRVTATIR